MNIIEIDSIGNDYGCLNLMTLNGKFYWCIEDWDTDFDDLDYWIEINEEIYNAIIKLQIAQKKIQRY